MRILLAVSSLCLLAVPATAQTGLLRPGGASFFSHEGNTLFLAAGTLADRKPLKRLDALVTATALAQGLKLLTHVRRPDGSSNDSFPSGHATAAFTLAQLAAQQTRRPEEKALWYLGAALIADSRVTLRRHSVTDVLAGAALGIVVARTPQLRISLLLPRRVQ